jgi:hypothetical protein
LCPAGDLGPDRLLVSPRIAKQIAVVVAFLVSLRIPRFVSLCVPQFIQFGETGVVPHFFDAPTPYTEPHIISLCMPGGLSFCVAGFISRFISFPVARLISFPVAGLISFRVAGLISFPVAGFLLFRYILVWLPFLHSASPASSRD